MSDSNAITLTPANIAELCERVDHAQRTATAMPKLTDDFPSMTLADGYAVQQALRHKHLATGARQAGWKAGLTSKAKMEQMGVHVPSIGFLMADMSRPEGSTVRTDDLVHPRVECEVAFVTKADLSGSDVTREDVLAATHFVMPAIEIIDSRFSGFKFDLPSVVADNCSSARYVLGGRPRYAEDIDLSTLGVVMEKNGQPIAMGASAAVMGHPAEAVALLVKVLDELGEKLPAGSLVLSGGITEAIAVQDGDHVIARYQELGTVAVNFGN
ncbi:2-oxo-3-hexenedioate decarboxylase [Hydrogenophaga sp. 5NK40-0174]|uniref:2-oxo-3-hexenedioate decarboxylase n=1 Tax=Hydrogenophaga sp. 5NK40-0174 TaxID=3127649 RepID=UPI0031036CE3